MGKMRPEEYFSNRFSASASSGPDLEKVGTVHLESSNIKSILEVDFDKNSKPALCCINYLCSIKIDTPVTWRILPFKRFQPFSVPGVLYTCS